MKSDANSNYHFVIDPAVGVGPVRFGMHKDVVANLFPRQMVSFFKGESKIRSDHFEYEGLIIHYDDKSKVTYIEVVEPKIPVTLELFGVDITGWNIGQTAELLRTKSTSIESDCYGFNAPDLGISLWNHDYELSDEGNSAKVECIGVSPLPAPS